MNTKSAQTVIGVHLSILDQITTHRFTFKLEQTFQYYIIKWELLRISSSKQRDSHADLINVQFYKWLNEPEDFSFHFDLFGRYKWNVFLSKYQCSNNALRWIRNSIWNKWTTREWIRLKINTKYVNKLFYFFSSMIQWICTLQLLDGSLNDSTMHMKFVGLEWHSLQTNENHQMCRCPIICEMYWFVVVWFVSIFVINNHDKIPYVSHRLTLC